MKCRRLNRKGHWQRSIWITRVKNCHPQRKEREVAQVLSRLPDVFSHWFSVQTGQKY